MTYYIHNMYVIYDLSLFINKLIMENNIKLKVENINTIGESYNESEDKNGDNLIELNSSILEIIEKFNLVNLDKLIYIDKSKLDSNLKQTIEKKEKIKTTIDLFNKGWTKENIGVVQYWMNYLSYCCLIYHFYLFKQKKIENMWAWQIIVLSALSSSLSLYQFNLEDYYIDITVKIFLTIFTLCTTLISTWMKKQNYVEHISELSKYSLKINKLKGDVASVLREPIKSRINYSEFISTYKENIINYISVRPLISPYDWKETIYIISKYYPELAAYEYPWNKIPNYGKNAINTYKSLKYNGIWNKIRYCYICKFCKNSTINKHTINNNNNSNHITELGIYSHGEGGPDEITQHNNSYDPNLILNNNIDFYKNLPEDDFDSHKFNCFLYDYDSDIIKHKPSNELHIFDDINYKESMEKSTIHKYISKNNTDEKTKIISYI